MITLRTLLRHPELGLRLIVGDPAADVEIRWAHVSELADPTPWLEGGELLLTTGLTLSGEPEEAAAYCRRLVARGVAALGISVGPDLTHPDIPAALRDSADLTGLRLVQVPHHAPLQSVVRAVADAISQDAAQPLRAQVDIQQRLMAEAASGTGLQGLVDRMSTPEWKVAVFDLRLRPIVASGDAGLRLDLELRSRIRQQLLTGVQGSVAIQSERDSCVLLPLLAEGQSRGYVIGRRSGPLTDGDRAVMKLAAPLLALLLEMRENTLAPWRAARAALIGLLLSGQKITENLPGALAAAGLSVQTTRVIRARLTSAAQRRAFLAGLCELGADALVQHSDDQTVAIVCEPVTDLRERLEVLAKELMMEEIGLSAALPIEDTVRGHIDAVRAQTAARIGGTILSTRTGRTDQLPALLQRVDPEHLGDFADSVLRPIDTHDAAHPRQELLPTLRAYFESIGSIEATSAALGVHRHTVRGRLRRIAEMCGYDVAVPSDYLELWLAIEVRQLQA